MDFHKTFRQIPTYSRWIKCTMDFQWAFRQIPPYSRWWAKGTVRCTFTLSFSTDLTMSEHWNRSTLLHSGTRYTPCYTKMSGATVICKMDFHKTFRQIPIYSRWIECTMDVHWAFRQIPPYSRWTKCKMDLHWAFQRMLLWWTKCKMDFHWAFNRYHHNLYKMDFANLFY